MENIKIITPEQMSDLDDTGKKYKNKEVVRKIKDGNLTQTVSNDKNGKGKDKLNKNTHSKPADEQQFEGIE